jgi:putative addiction module component (TIGR02574 family)
VPEALTLTDAEREELDRRLAAHAQSPDAGVPWDELRERLRKSP